MRAVTLQRTAETRLHPHVQTMARGPGRGRLITRTCREPMMEEAGAGRAGCWSLTQTPALSARGWRVRGWTQDTGPVCGQEPTPHRNPKAGADLGYYGRRRGGAGNNKRPKGLQSDWQRPGARSLPPG